MRVISLFKGVQITFGSLDGNNNCTNANSFPPPSICYRTASNAECNCNQNLSDTSKYPKFEFLFIGQPSDSLFQLYINWPSSAVITSAFFISNIVILTNNKCGSHSNINLAKVGEQCLQYPSVSYSTYNCNNNSYYGPVFGSASREVRLRIFDLSTGKCSVMSDSRMCRNISQVPMRPITTMLTPTTTLTSTPKIVSASTPAIAISPSIPTSLPIASSPPVTKPPSVSVPPSPGNITTENCLENTTNETLPIGSTRRILCNDSSTNDIRTQSCNKTDATNQSSWVPDLLRCTNRLPLSEDLYTITLLENATAAELTQLLISFLLNDTNITPGDLILSSDILVEITQVGCSGTNQELEAQSILLDNHSGGEGLNEPQQLLFVNNIFTSMEFVSLNCFDTDVSDSTDNIRLIVLTVDLREPIVDSFLQLTHNGLASFLIPRSVLEAAQSGGYLDFLAVSYLLDGLETILSRPLPKSDPLYQSEVNYQLGSPVVSLSISCSIESCVEAIERDGIQFVIKHNTEISMGNSVCAFWNFSNSSKYEAFWSTEGCKVLKQTTEQTECVCNHLTHFGILFGRSSEISSENETALLLVTYIGVGLSLLALVLTVISFTILRSQWNVRTFVHINLCSTLFISQLMFVLGIDKTSGDIACATIAILLHYFFLTTFMWMLMEGVVLYIVLVKVFTQVDWKYYTGFTLLCYGGPLLYMIMCVPLGLARTDEWSYGSDDVCWLTYDDHFIWAFIAPVIVIILINVGVLIIILRIMRKHQGDAMVKDQTRKERAWYWFRGSMSLIIIMGINWIFGVLLFHEYLLPLIYLFAISTALQGVWIFLLFIVASKQIRDDYGRLFSSVQMRLSKLTTSSNMSTTSSMDALQKSTNGMLTGSNSIDLFERSIATSCDRNDRGFADQHYQMYGMT
ncbi:adhesion G protein-coupled receptor L3-like isoform X2 [Dysidea avara]|uniref:adhesion G protein-coupled receptor L3-like isoform X2 n=1 Tax=Dysidea avara TaxID=196820 RepID=UPI003320C2FC